MLVQRTLQVCSRLDRLTWVGAPCISTLGCLRMAQKRFPSEKSNMTYRAVNKGPGWGQWRMNKSQENMKASGSGNVLAEQIHVPPAL